jgi:hypothetical protein
MSVPPSLLPLLKTAAELRANGHSWITVGEKVHRHERTCRRWPDKYPVVWNVFLREEVAKVFAETGSQAVRVLRGLAATTKDEKLQQNTFKFLARLCDPSRDWKVLRDAGQPNSQLLALVTFLESLTDADRQAFLEDFLARAMASRPDPGPGSPTDAGPAQPQ